MKLKRIIARLIAVAMAGALVLPILTAGSALKQTPAPEELTPALMTLSAESTPLPSDTREEVVYANVTSDGTVKDINVVTILHNGAARAVTDYGNYSAVKNLTTTEPITLTDGTVSVNAPMGSLYYQGTLKGADLPWDIAITYLLNGQELSPNDLAGKSGHLEIRLATTQNPRVDPLFFNNYLLQVTMTLDTSKCSGITATGGMLANAGINKRVTFTVMPGKAGNLTAAADVTDFSMEGIELAAVPLALKIDMPDTGDILKQLTRLSDGVSSLNDGVAQLKDGSAELKNGAADLKSGAASFGGGLKLFDANAQDLVGGSSQIKDALSTISASLNGSPGSFNLSELGQLPDGLSQLATGLKDTASGLTDFKTGFTASYDALKSSILEIPDGTIPQEALDKLYQDNGSSPDKKAALDTLVAFYTSGTKTKLAFEAVRPFFDSADASLGKLCASVSGISDSVSTLSAQVKGALDSSNSAEQLAQLSAGFTALSAKYEEFHQGLAAYSAGMARLDAGYGQLSTGISDFAAGVGSLSDGIGQTYAGTSELSAAVNDIPGQIKTEIEKLMKQYDKSDLIPVSLASSRNINTVSVQFVIKTDRIEKPAAAIEAPKPTQTVDFWTKFLDLFR